MAQEQHGVGTEGRGVARRAAAAVAAADALELYLAALAGVLMGCREKGMDGSCLPQKQGAVKSMHIESLLSWASSVCCLMHLCCTHGSCWL